MSNTQDLALTVLMLGLNIAFFVFTWQHSLWGMGLTFAGALALSNPFRPITLKELE